MSIDMVDALISELKGQLIELWTEDGKLRFRAPEGAMTAEVRGRLKAHKAEIIDFLEGASSLQSVQDDGISKSRVSSPYSQIVRTPDQDDYELSSAQWRLWVLAQMENSSVAYNVPLHQLISGPLDVALLEQVLGQLIGRHEALRTCFVLKDGGPRQKIIPLEAIDSTLPVEDVSGMADPDAVTWRLSLEEARRPFDLAIAPLLRAKLVRLGAQRHVLMLTLHHIVCDGVSIGVLNREMAQLYSQVELRPLPMQYRDFAHWQNGWLDGAEAAEQRKYWLDKLGGQLPILELPTDRPRPVVQTFNGAELMTDVDAETLAKLKQLARGQGVTLFMLLLGLIKVLVYRMTNQTDLIVGSPVAARHTAELYDQIGFYLNTLPFRTKLDPKRPFREYLQQVKQTVTGGLDNQMIPLDQLVNELDLQRDLSHGALFDVMLVLQNQTDGGMRLGDLEVETFFQHSGTSKVDLTFQFGESASGLHLGIEYNSDLFDEERIERLTGQFKTLVGSVLTDVNRPVGELGILPVGEVERIQRFEHGVGGDGGGFDLAPKIEIGSAPVDPHKMPFETLVGWFESQAAETPDGIAVQCAGDRLSYGELNGRANRLARHLVKHGIGAGIMVPLCIERSVDMIVAIVAILKTGAAYVPIDPTTPADRMAFIQEDVGAKIWLTQRSLVNKLAGLVDGTLLVDDSVLADYSSDNLERVVRPDDLAYVIYTSGSTGRPKGVMVTHRNVTRLFTSTDVWFNFGQQDVWTLFHSFAFDFSVWEIWGALLYGGRLVVVPYALSRDPAAYYRLVQDEAVTVLNQTPSAFKQFMMADKGQSADLALRHVIFGGEALDMPSLAPWFARHGDERPKLINMYGITETTVHVTYRPIVSADVDRSASLIGQPIPDLSLQILDPNGQRAPIGVAGELYVGGAGVAKGYLNRPGLTKEKFLKFEVRSDKPEVGSDQSPLITSNLLLQTLRYRTGDLARWTSDGDIEYLGRIDSQVQVRGFRIELGEIEMALGRCDGVETAVVMVEQDGQGDDQIVACLVSSDQRSDEPIVAHELRQQLQSMLPDYMIPTRFVPIEAVPLTRNGKSDRKALLALIGTAEQSTGTQYVAPRNEVEQQMATIWSAVLQQPQVGIHDNFFDLGGHSLKGMKIVGLMQEQVGVTVSFLDLFREPTIASLAAKIDESKETRVERKVASLPNEIAIENEVGLEIETASEEELALLWEDEG